LLTRWHTNLCVSMLQFSAFDSLLACD